MKISANLSMLWADMPLNRAIYQAATAGFDAVECHWPFEFAPGDVKTALDRTGLQMIALNTGAGDRSKGQFGLLAQPENLSEGRRAIVRSVDYARRVGAKAVHLMPGLGQGADALRCFQDHIVFATDYARDVLFYLEMINPIDVPGYFLQDFSMAERLIKAVDAPNLKLMFDIYHAGRIGVPVVEVFARLMPMIDHVQFARVPDRGPPIGGALVIHEILSDFAKLGWAGYAGAEFVPDKDMRLPDWLPDLQAIEVELRIGR